MYRIYSLYIIRKDGSRYDFFIVICNGIQVAPQFETWEEADQFIREEIKK